MFLNISTFDLVEAPATSGPCGSVPEEGLGQTTVWAVGTVPSLLLLIAVLIILKQNLDRILSILNSIQNCLRSLTPLREVGAVVAPPPTVVVRQGLPRNLTDSELVQRNELYDELVSPFESEV